MNHSAYYASLPPIPRRSLDIPRPLRTDSDRHRRPRPLTVYEPFGPSRPSFGPPPSPTSSTSSRSSNSTAGTVRSLRHTCSPRRENLRQLRIKESEACLQRAYERQTLAYLDGSMFLSPDSLHESDEGVDSDDTPEPRQSVFVGM